MATTRVDGLEIDQDLDVQQRAWRIQRVGWGIMTLFVLAAVAGLLGSGPLSHARAELSGTMSVEYQRFARLETNETLTVRLEAAATAGDTVRISLDRAFLDAAMVYVFAVAEPRTPMLVSFNFEPQATGRQRGTVSVESAAEPRSITFRQLVYP